MHELHTPELLLPGLIHKDGGETDVAVDQTTVRAQEAYGFLENNSVLEQIVLKQVVKMKTRNLGTATHI